MNFSKTKHGDDLLHELSLQNTPLSINILEKRLNISRRSIFYTIKQVNKELNEMNIDEIQNIRDNGYLLTIEAKKAIQSHAEKITKAHSFTELNAGKLQLKNLTKKDRTLIMKYFLISRPYTSLAFLTNLFDVSKNTVITDIREIKHDFGNKLNIKNGKKGKYIFGNEKNKRKWIFSHLSIVLNKLDGKFDFLPNPNYIKQLHLLEQITGNIFTDDTRNFLAYFIQWTIERSHSNFTIPPVALKPEDTSSLSYIWAKSFLNDEGIYSIFEAKLLAELVNTQSFSHININNEIFNELLPITEKIIHEFSNLTNINLPAKIGNHNFQQSLTVHLISTYYRGKYHIPYHNPLLQQIKTSYRETFEITKAALQPFTKYSSIKLSDDEVALITIYFSGALRSTQLSQNKQDNIIAVVCSSGIGTSRLLLSQLTQRYPTLNFIGPLNMFEFENLSKQGIRLILTTARIPSLSSQNIFQIPALPTTADWANLDSYLVKNNIIKTKSNSNLNIVTIMDIISNYARIVEPQNLENALLSYISKPSNTKSNENKDYFSTYKFIDAVVPWQKAIDLSFKDMLKNNIVTEQYVSKIKNLTEKRGDYMAIGKGVFLAHATPNNVNQLGVSFNYFKQPFYVFDHDKPITFVVGLAPINQTSHLKILSNLLQCLQNKNWLKKLAKVNNSTDLKRLLIDGNLI